MRAWPFYDSGVQRPTATDRHTGSNVIEFGTSAATLYGYNNQTTDYGFRRMAVTASGVTVIDVTNAVISGFNVDFEMGPNNRAYATSGRVVDVAPVSIVATYPDLPFGFINTLVEPDVDRTFFLHENAIKVFDNTTFVPLGTRPVPGIVGTPGSLIKWHEGGLAFRTSGNQVFLVTCLPPECHEPQLTGVPHDVDGDGRADIGVYRASTGEWFIHRSSDGALFRRSWGCPLCADRPVAADYDGDAMADLAVHRVPSGEWLINPSTIGGMTQHQLGCPSCADIPVPADYDGDGRVDVAVYRYSSGDWIVYRTGGAGLLYRTWGCAFCGDLPAVGDYDGDGRSDLAVYRSSTGEWFVDQSGGGGLLHRTRGCQPCNDVPAGADYDGDGRSDIAVYRAFTGEWFVNRSGGAGALHISWGCRACNDLPVAADYDGDGRADIAVYRNSTGEWFVLRSSNSTLWRVQWGAPALGDVPLALPSFLASGLAPVAADP
jgi:hypothetical protein